MFLLTVDRYVSMHIFVFLTISSTMTERIHFEQKDTDFSQIFTVEKNTRIFEISPISHSYMYFENVTTVHVTAVSINLNSSNVVEHLSTIPTFASLQNWLLPVFFFFFFLYPLLYIRPRRSLLLTSYQSICNYNDTDARTRHHWRKLNNLAIDALRRLGKQSFRCLRTCITPIEITPIRHREIRTTRMISFT